MKKGFTFPEKNNEENAWETQLHGLPGCTVKVDIECINFRTKPFQFIAPNGLPKKLCNAFKGICRPILLEISKAPCVVLPNESDSISSKTIDSTFGVTSDDLKSKYCCLFASKNHLNWVVSTWNMKITASKTNKIGNESDVQFLGDVRVNCHKKNRKRKSAFGSATKKRFFLLC